MSIHMIAPFSEKKQCVIFLNLREDQCYSQLTFPRQAANRQHLLLQNPTAQYVRHATTKSQPDHKSVDQHTPFSSQRHATPAGDLRRRRLHPRPLPARPPSIKHHLAPAGQPQVSPGSASGPAASAALGTPIPAPRRRPNPNSPHLRPPAAPPPPSPCEAHYQLTSANYRPRWSILVPQGLRSTYPDPYEANQECC